MEFGGKLRFAIRDLSRSPGYTAVAVCTLAIAIGATTAVFSVIDKVLLRPLPINEPDRVVVIWTREQLNAGAIGEFSYPAFRGGQRDVQTLESLAAIGSVNWSHSRTTLGPGLHASRRSHATTLSQDGARLVQSYRLRHAFVVAQVALALVLLVCGGLVARSFVNLLRVDTGFDAIAIGLTVPAGAGRVLTSLLYGVQPADPLTLSGMAALFMAVSTAAVMLPVWRATRVDPVRALRQP